MNTAAEKATDQGSTMRHVMEPIVWNIAMSRAFHIHGRPHASIVRGVVRDILNAEHRR